VKGIGHFSHLADGFLDICKGRPSDVAQDAALRLERQANKAAGLVEGEQDRSGGKEVKCYEVVEGGRRGSLQFDVCRANGQKRDGRRLVVRHNGTGDCFEN
jgi:hypothetical protein